MTTWRTINSFLAIAAFGSQALCGLVAAGWLAVNRLPTSYAEMSIVWVLLCPVPLLGWLCRPRQINDRSVRRMVAWTAVMMVVLMLFVPVTKAFLAVTPMCVIVGMLIVLSELLGLAAATELRVADGCDPVVGAGERAAQVAVR